MESMTERVLQLGALADPDQFRGPVDLAGGDAEAYLVKLERMLLIRSVEETIGALVESGEVRCPCHLAIGQEAVAVGVATHLTPRDRIFGAHRSHSHYLALGGSPEALLAEVLGKDTGCSGGLGGSMHLREPSIGLVGTVPIVAATIPLAVGAGLAARMDGNGAIAVSFFGDGATEEGVFHESLNLAVMLRAPVLFVCENNLFSSHLHVSLRQPYDSVGRFGAVHGLPTRVVDGNDIVAVESAVAELVAEARQGRPVFLEAVTYRWRGHVGHREDIDVGVGRSDDLVRWKKRDPIARLASALDNADIATIDVVSSLKHRVDVDVRNALERARSAPYPDAARLLDSVYPVEAGLL